MGGLETEMVVRVVKGSEMGLTYSDIFRVRFKDDRQSSNK